MQQKLQKNSKSSIYPFWDESKSPRWSKSHGYQLLKTYNCSIAISFKNILHLNNSIETKSIGKKYGNKAPVNICRYSLKKICILSIPIYYLKCDIFPIIVSVTSPRYTAVTCKAQLRILPASSLTSSVLFAYTQWNSCTGLQRTGITS